VQDVRNLVRFLSPYYQQHQRNAFYPRLAACSGAIALPSGHSVYKLISLHTQQSSAFAEARDENSIFSNQITGLVIALVNKKYSLLGLSGYGKFAIALLKKDDWLNRLE
jgi:hypothetical protein